MRMSFAVEPERGATARDRMQPKRPQEEQEETGGQPDGKKDQRGI